jgi:hypothetical protein
MTVEEKITQVEKQIRRLINGGRQIVACPFCDRLNAKGAPFCCESFAAAAIAVLEDMDSRRRIAHAAKSAGRERQMTTATQSYHSGEGGIRPSRLMP